MYIYAPRRPQNIILYSQTIYIEQRWSTDNAEAIDDMCAVV